MIDCIAGYHLNPWTCGIAKFNAILAKELNVPVIGLASPDLRNYSRPLLSIKMSEFTDDDAKALASWVDTNVGRFDIFLHAFDDIPFEHRLLSAAAKVYCGNRELSHQLSPARPDIVELFCPGTLLNSQRFQETEIKVFTFGMAHRFECRCTGGCATCSTPPARATRCTCQRRFMKTPASTARSWSASKSCSRSSPRCISWATC